MRNFVIACVLSILIIANIPASQGNAEIEPVIKFDKAEYGPFDDVQVTIAYPPANTDPKAYDGLRAKVSTSSGISTTLGFSENGINSGVFLASIKLTPYPEMWYGELKVVRGDDLIVEFKDGDKAFTSKVDINFHRSGIKLNKDAFSSIEKMEIFVWDLDMNRKPHTIDTLPVKVWSTTDRGGINVVLREINANAGIFHEFITFTRDEASSGTRLRVTDGDTVTVKYTDNTLPSPAKLSSNGFETVEVEELFVSALISDCFCPPLERIHISEPRVFELTDEIRVSRAEFSVGDQVIIKTEISSVQKYKQEFAYIVQVKDSNDIVVSLSWVKGELKPDESIKIERNWVPEYASKYTIENFAWVDVDKPIALSPTRTTEVEVK